jgi:hypothetical protein
MKLAYLILAHSEPLQLSRLIGRLEHKDASFFIHNDAKADIKTFEEVLQKLKVNIVPNRVDVNWGAYSIVQATINGFKSIIEADADFDVINLLSGSDYPLKSNDEITDFFSDHQGQNFLEFLSIRNEWQEAIPRLTKYHLTNFTFPGKYLVQKWLNRVTSPRKMPNGLIPVGRSQWMSLTSGAVKYILDYLQENANVTQFFKLTWAPDEIIFQTILYNSPYRDQLVNDNLRYIDWRDGKARPKTLTPEDLPKLMESGKLFARKFDLKKYPEILDQIDYNLNCSSLQAQFTTAPKTLLN